MRSVGWLIPALLICAAGCAEKVTSAQCNACFGKSYSASDCAKWAVEAGCASHQFLPTVGGGCNNGCSFEDCDEMPTCGEGTGLPDSGTDALQPDLDPACSSGGLFPNCDLCQGKCDKININGAISYTCACGAPCPCGFSCGSIPLKVGGTIGSVCAP